LSELSLAARDASARDDFELRIDLKKLVWVAGNNDSLKPPGEESHTGIDDVRRVALSAECAERLRLVEAQRPNFNDAGADRPSQSHLSGTVAPDLGDHSGGCLDLRPMLDSELDERPYPSVIALERNKSTEVED
jgi:hypothetical protein